MTWDADLFVYGVVREHRRRLAVFRAMFFAVLVVVGFVALALMGCMGCGTLVADPPGPTVHCFAVEAPCPSAAEVSLALDALATKVDGLDPAASLVVRWHDKDHVFWSYTDTDGKTHDVFAYTIDANTVVVRDVPTMLHEAVHAHFWRTVGDPDRNHAPPPGPWSVDIDTAIQLTAEELQ